MQARKPILTSCEQELLNQTRSRGMTAEIIKSWYPDPSAYKNRTVVAGSRDSGKHVVENTFTKDHVAAVLYLMDRNHFSAEAAIQEVSGITAGEARFLVIAFKSGVRGADLRAINTEKCTIDSHEFHEAFRYLVAKQKLNRQQALQALDGLTPYQVRMLHELYQYGLRAEHIHAVLEEDLNKYADAFDSFGSSGIFRSFFTNTFKNALKQNPGVSEALQDTLAKCNQRAEERKVTFLKIPHNPTVSFMRNQGLFADALPEKFTSTHEKLFSMLKRDGYSKEDAMAQLRQLDAVGARVMLTYFKDGVRAEHVVAATACSRNELERVVAERVTDGQKPLDALASLTSADNSNNVAMM